MKVKHISTHEFNAKFGLQYRAPVIAFVTGNDPHDQHYVRQTQTSTPAQIVRKVNKLKQAWGV